MFGSISVYYFIVIVLLQTLGQKTATMSTRSASQAEASAPPTAQPSPPAEPEESDESANRDGDADQLTIQQDVPPKQDAPKKTGSIFRFGSQTKGSYRRIPTTESDPCSGSR